MTENSITISIPTSSDKLRQVFPEDPKYDIQILFKDKSFKLQKAHLRLQSVYFRRTLTAERSILQICEDFDSNIVQKIMQCFYGAPLTVDRKDVLLYYPIVQFLQVECLIEQLRKDMTLNSHLYCFFPLFNLAYKYDIQKVFEKCLMELEEHKFQQIKTQKEDMMDICQELFKLIIKAHNRAKKQNRSLDVFGIKYLIAQFCDKNKFSKDHKNILKFQLIDKNALSSAEYAYIFLKDGVIEQQPQRKFQAGTFSISPTRSEGNILMQTGPVKLNYQIQKTIQLQMDTTFQKKRSKQLLIHKQNLKDQIKFLSQSTISQNKKSQTIKQQFVALRKSISQKQNQPGCLNQKILSIDSQLSSMQKSLSDQTQRIQSLMSSTKQMFQKYDEIKDKASVSMESEAESFWNQKMQPLVAEMKSNKSIKSNNSKVETVKSRPNGSVSNVSVNKSQAPSREVSFVKEDYWIQDKVQFTAKPSITKNSKQIQNLTALIAPQKFMRKRLTLLHKASRQNYKNIGKNSKASEQVAQNLRVKLKNKGGILFLIRTEYDKLIGGYKSIPLDLYGEGSVQDSNAFILSVTSCKKFKVKNNHKEEALEISKGYIICFSTDLMISDKLFEQQNYCGWPADYESNKQLKDRGSIWLAGQSLFSIKEIQVYQVEDLGVDMVI